jgi:hypothetical protein
MMDAQTKNNIHLKNLFRIFISASVSIVAAEIIFIIFWSFTLFPAISDSPFPDGSIFYIGILAGMVAGILIFMKINKHLKGRMQN